MKRSELARRLIANPDNIINTNGGEVMNKDRYYEGHFNVRMWAVIPQRFDRPSIKEVEEGLTRTKEYARLYKSMVDDIWIVKIWDGQQYESLEDD